MYIIYIIAQLTLISSNFAVDWVGLVDSRVIIKEARELHVDVPLHSTDFGRMI